MQKEQVCAIAALHILERTCSWKQITVLIAACLVRTRATCSPVLPLDVAGIYCFCNWCIMGLCVELYMFNLRLFSIEYDELL